MVYLYSTKKNINPTNNNKYLLKTHLSLNLICFSEVKKMANKAPDIPMKKPVNFCPINNK